MPPTTADRCDSTAVASFAVNMEAFAATCDDRQRRILAALVLAAMDPVERMRWLAPPGVLTDREDAFLRVLESEQAEGL